MHEDRTSIAALPETLATPIVATLETTFRGSPVYVIGFSRSSMEHRRPMVRFTYRRGQGPEWTAPLRSVAF